MLAPLQWNSTLRGIRLLRAWCSQCASNASRLNGTNSVYWLGRCARAHYVVRPLGNCGSNEPAPKVDFCRDTMLSGHWVTVGVMNPPPNSIFAACTRRSAGPVHTTTAEFQKNTVANTTALSLSLFLSRPDHRESTDESRDERGSARREAERRQTHKHGTDMRTHADATRETTHDTTRERSQICHARAKAAKCGPRHRRRVKHRVVLDT
jgi:hypothetical protein